MGKFQKLLKHRMKFNLSISTCLIKGSIWMIMAKIHLDQKLLKIQTNLHSTELFLKSTKVSFLRYLRKEYQ